MWRVDGRAGAGIDPADRGLAYGDGVFRTLTVVQGRPQVWARQFAVLQRDAARLGLECPPADVWREDIDALVAECGDGVIKCTLTRGVAGRGYAPPASARPSRIVQWAPAPVWPAGRREQGVQLHLCELRLSCQPRLAGVKHLNRLENVLARAEWSDAAIAEGLLLDVDGWVVEGTMSNVFWRSGSQWYTPRLDRCGVTGVTRERLLQVLSVRGTPAHEVYAPLERVLESDEVLLCNSLIGLWPVRALLQRHWQTFPTISVLEQALAGEWS